MCAPLTEKELEAVRVLLVQEARRVWLFGTVRAGSSWVVITLGALALGYESIVKMLKSLVGND